MVAKRAMRGLGRIGSIGDGCDWKWNLAWAGLSWARLDAWIALQLASRYA